MHHLKQNLETQATQKVVSNHANPIAKNKASVQIDEINIRVASFVKTVENLLNSQEINQFIKKEIGKDYPTLALAVKESLLYV